MFTKLSVCPPKMSVCPPVPCCASCFLASHNFLPLVLLLETHCALLGAGSLHFLCSCVPPLVGVHVMQQSPFPTVRPLSPECQPVGCVWCVSFDSRLTRQCGSCLFWSAVILTSDICSWIRGPGVGICNYSGPGWFCRGLGCHLASCCARHRCPRALEIGSCVMGSLGDGAIVCPAVRLDLGMHGCHSPAVCPCGCALLCVQFSPCLACVGSRTYLWPREASPVSIRFNLFLDSSSRVSRLFLPTLWPQVSLGLWLV